MIYIKDYSVYEHFPNNKPVEDKPFIHCYSGEMLGRYKVEQPAIALILEPRSIEPTITYVDEHPEEFKYIFTHDSRLLKYPNARFLLWGIVWGWSDIPKTKNISLISSYKEMCDLHKIRKQLALEYENSGLVDCFGSYRDRNKKCTTYEAHADYRFAIAIENHIDDRWFTEKILNCFSNKTIPIYWGARKISEYFNPDGIIEVNSADDIRRVVKELNDGRSEEVYNRMLPAINDNYERVKEWDIGDWRKRFFEQYTDILEELLND